LTIAASKTVKVLEQASPLLLAVLRSFLPVPASIAGWCCARGLAQLFRLDRGRPDAWAFRLSARGNSFVVLPLVLALAGRLGNQPS